MSAPRQFQSQPKRSGGGVATLVALLLLPVMVVVCGGLCAGVLFVFTHHGQSLAQRAEEAFEQVAPPQLALPAGPPVRQGVNDWMSQRVLAPVYTAALDAVTGNKKVIERLGKPVEPLEDADELYRRRIPANPDEIAGSNVKGTVIEFDIKGPKGGAVVTVVAASDAPQGQNTGWMALRATKILVKFSDGTSIDVPPPKDQAGTEIR